MPLRRTEPLLSLLRIVLSPVYATRTYIYNRFSRRRVFTQGSIPKYILISLASVVYALFVLNTNRNTNTNQYCASHYGSTFQAVLHLQRNRPTLGV